MARAHQHGAYAGLHRRRGLPGEGEWGSRWTRHLSLESKRERVMREMLTCSSYRLGRPRTTSVSARKASFGFGSSIGAVLRSRATTRRGALLAQRRAHAVVTSRFSPHHSSSFGAGRCLPLSWYETHRAQDRERLPALRHRFRTGSFRRRGKTGGIASG